MPPQIELLPRMSNVNILFHTPQTLDKLDSGSSVRPAKMIDAFEQLGYNVDTVTGGSEERREQIKNIRRNNRGYEFCYSEPTAWPLHPLVDYRLYWYLQSNSISTGIFYRDIYWKFPKLFDNSGLKYWELQLRYRLDLAVMKRIGDVIYTPSTSFGEHLETPTTPLPPGGIDQTSTSKSSTQLQRLIYVGGASRRYGSELLSKAHKIAAADQNITLDLVTRKSEYQSLPTQVRQRFQSDSVSVHHASGDDLISLYKRADAGIIPLIPSSYNNIAIPVKLYEYLSYGLPVITTDLNEVASFVQSTDCGVVCNADPDDLAQAIVTLSKNSQEYQRKKQNTIQTLKENRWIDRAKKVASDLQ
jgi:glycosyltransferase involved in cell wall biosynthesis